MTNYSPYINCQRNKARLPHTVDFYMPWLDNAGLDFRSVKKGLDTTYGGYIICDDLEYISWKKIIPNIIENDPYDSDYWGSDYISSPLYLGITNSGDLIEFGRGIYFTKLSKDFFDKENPATIRHYPELNNIGYGSYLRNPFFRYERINENDEDNRYLNHGKPPGGGEWVDIAAGSGHFLALSSNGDVYSWGQNHYGQIGNGQRAGSFTIHCGFGALESSAISGIVIQDIKKHIRSGADSEYIQTGFNIKPNIPHGILGTGCVVSAELGYEIRESSISGIIYGKDDILSLSASGVLGGDSAEPSLIINKTIHGKFSITNIEIKNAGINYSNINLVYNNDLVSRPDITFELNTYGSIQNININDGGIFDTIPTATIVGDGEGADISIEWQYDLKYLSDISAQYTSKNISINYQTLISNGSINLSDNNLAVYMTGATVISGGYGYFDCHATYGTQVFPIVMGSGSMESETIVYPSSGIMKRTVDISKYIEYHHIIDSESPNLDFVYLYGQDQLVDYAFSGNTVTFSAQNNMDTYRKFIATTRTISPTVVQGVSSCKYIVCDKDTSFALDQDNNLYIWGRNILKNYGFSPDFNSGNDILSPRVVQPLAVVPDFNFFGSGNPVLFKVKQLKPQKLGYKKNRPVLIDENGYIFYFEGLPRGGASSLTMVYKDIDLPYDGIEGKLPTTRILWEVGGSFISVNIWSATTNKDWLSALKFCSPIVSMYPPSIDNRIIDKKLCFNLVNAGTDYSTEAFGCGTVSFKLVSAEALTTPQKNFFYLDCTDEFLVNTDSVANLFNSMPDEFLVLKEGTMGGEEYNLPEISLGSNDVYVNEDGSITINRYVTKTISPVTISTEIVSDCYCQNTRFLPPDFQNRGMSIQPTMLWVPPFWRIPYKIIMVIEDPATGSKIEIDGGAYGMFDLASAEGLPPPAAYSGYDGPNDFFVFQNPTDPLEILDAYAIENTLIESNDISSGFILSNIAIDKQSFAINETGLNFPGYPFFVFDKHPNESAPIYNISLSSNLYGIAVEKEGRGFTAPPNVIINGETKDTTIGPGNTAKATAVIEGPIDIAIKDGGMFYKKAPIIKFVGGSGIPPAGQKISLNKNGSISSIRFEYSGLYSSVPQIVLTDEEFIYDSAKSAILDIKINGSVKYIKIDESGTNYQYAPQILVDTANNYMAPDLYDKLLSKDISIQDYDSNSCTVLAQSSLNNTRFSTSPSRPTEYQSPHKYNDVSVTKPQQEYVAKYTVPGTIVPGTPIHQIDLLGVNNNRYSSSYYHVSFFYDVCGYVLRSDPNNICSPLTDYIQFPRPNYNNDSVTLGVGPGQLDGGFELLMIEEGQCYVGPVYLKNPKVTARKLFSSIQKSGEINPNTDLFETEESWWDPVNGYTQDYPPEWAISISGEIKFGHTQDSGYAYDNRSHRYAKYLTYEKICNRLNLDNKCLFFDEIKWESEPTLFLFDQRGNSISFNVSLDDNKVNYISASSSGWLTLDAKLHIEDGTILFQEADIETLIDTDNKSGVYGIIINDPGYGYFDSDLSINIDHNTGSGLEIEVHLYTDSAVPQGIAGVSILSSGENYTAPPVINITNNNRSYKNNIYIDKINNIFKTMPIDTLCYYSKYFREYANPLHRSLYQVNFTDSQYFYYGNYRDYFVRHDGVQSIALGGKLYLYKDLPKLKLKNPFMYYDIPIPEIKFGTTRATRLGRKHVVHPTVIDEE